jgi:hypothetical protein
VTVWVSVKDKFMMLHRTLVTRFNLRNKFKEIKMKKRYSKIEKIIKSKKMILRWKVSLMEKCMIRKNQRKVKMRRRRRRFLTNRWVKLIMKREKKI